MVRKRADAIVIGAGIVGAACARELARAGLRVIVLEASFAAGGTTAAGMGHLGAMDDSPAQLALTAESVRMWHELRPTLHAAVEYDACGTIWVAEDAEQAASVEAKASVYHAHGLACELLTAKRLASLEPNLRSGLAGGLLVNGDAVIYPPRAVLALLDDARAHGAAVREQCTATGIIPHGVRTADGELHADVVINAAGAQGGALTPELPIVPRKGHLAITDRAPGFCRHQLVELGYLASAHLMTSESVAFNVQPRVTGQVLIGSSRELAGWQPGLNRKMLRAMLERAIRFMPALARLAVVRVWTGFRPATPDKLPLIGRWEPVDGLWIAAGHEGLGITTSLGTGRLLADLVLGRPTSLDAAPFAPMRVLARGTLAGRGAVA
jgi:glycine/D-amino acid oxidase-like deaminating enzyme